jgi:serine/threonine-protein kinase RsbW
VLGFKYLENPKPRIIYPPENHREMIGMLYQNIGDQVECGSIDQTIQLNEQCVTEVKVHTLRSLAEISIVEYGLDTMKVMRNEMRKIFADEIQVIELYLSLSDPMTPTIVPQLESMGFIFTGVLPETSQGDSLIMQYFNGVYIDYDQIVLVTDVAKKLLEYIKQHDPQAS